PRQPATHYVCFGLEGARQMARNQKNFTFFTYVDDDAVSWNKRGESGGAAAAVDGNAAADAAQPTWIETKTNRVPRVIYQDPTPGRTVDPIIYTPTAFNAIAKGDIVAVQVEGLATTVNYTAIQKKGEHKRGTPVFSHHLADS